MSKVRLDHYLVENGLASNLQEAASLCIRGLVHDSSSQLLKPGMQVNLNRSDIKVKQVKNHKYVARSALKLKDAIECYDIDVKSKICADLGCSTGGFTQILLENGAYKIYAVDVASGFFAYSLRNNPKITLLEKTNVKHLSKSLIPEDLDLICCDLSFIGLTNCLAPSLSLLKSGGELIALIKPQFELPKHLVEEGGIIKDPMLHKQACDSVANWLEGQGFNIVGIKPCSQLGMKGNQEFLLYAFKS
ncbi:hemolysin A [Candidatus Phycorickettsia trachydisci]|uniref:Hemolysin A n=1 Tax=Candidatus Phycorickettsia trachydisci TaxID=2115978 RepID=A0A2P1PA00_9RICK|nr:TlyA family RNA methyltransferase [Candidatus Phycorickettsia trachydisci]AVP88112.1 hemolysin A [Candidatus Phycorickettsia trachydisci]